MVKISGIEAPRTMIEFFEFVKEYQTQIDELVSEQRELGGYDEGYNDGILEGIATFMLALEGIAPQSPTQYSPPKIRNWDGNAIHSINADNGSVVWLEPDDLKHCVNHVADEYGHVALFLDAGNGTQLFTVQSIDLEWS